MKLCVLVLVLECTLFLHASPPHFNSISSGNSSDQDGGDVTDAKSKFRSIKYSTNENKIQTLASNKTNDSVPPASTQQQLPQSSLDENSVEESSLKDDLDTWEAPELFRRNFPYYLAGYDDENRPIWITEMGRFNVKQVVEAGPEAVAILNKYVKQAAYHILKSLHEQPIPDFDVSEIIFITDFDEMGLFQIAHTPTLMFVLNLCRTYKDLIANHLGATVVINANYFAEMLINLVKPVFGRVMDKTEVYGTQQAKWLPVLRRYMPPDTIPSWYGGRGNFKPLKVYG